MVHHQGGRGWKHHEGGGSLEPDIPNGWANIQGDLELGGAETPSALHEMEYGGVNLVPTVVILFCLNVLFRNWK